MGRTQNLQKDVLGMIMYINEIETSIVRVIR